MTDDVWNTDGGRIYALNMLKLGSGRLLPAEALTMLGEWIDELTTERDRRREAAS